MARRIMRACAVLCLLSCWLGQASGQSDSTSRDYVYKLIDGGSLQLTVDYPSNWTASDHRPAILFFFGGGWKRGSIDQFEGQSRYFTSRGMVGIRPEYRVKERHGTTPAESVEDAMDAFDWIVQRADSLGIDAERIVVSGSSAGGLLAACTAHCTWKRDDEFEPSAMVLFNPVLSFFGADRIRKAYPVASDNIARAISPDLHVEMGAPPALVIFGTEDWVLDYATEYVETARNLGNRVELYLAEGEHHAFYNSTPWYEHTLLEAAEFLESLGYLEPLRSRRTR